MPVDRCHDAMNLLLAKDLGRWTGLPSDCTLMSLRALAPRFELGEDEWQATLGEETHAASYRKAKVNGYVETFKIWLRDGAIARLSVELPELPDPPRLLETLGAPDAKLDTWLATSPTVRPQGEWVWATRGLALVLSSNQQNVMELILFPSTTVEHYRANLRYSEPPREEGFEPGSR
jgi:hypothetical protein